MVKKKYSKFGQNCMMRSDKQNMKILHIGECMFLNLGVISSPNVTINGIDVFGFNIATTAVQTVLMVGGGYLLQSVFNVSGAAHLGLLLGIANLVASIVRPIFHKITSQLSIPNPMLMIGVLPIIDIPSISSFFLVRALMLR